MQGVHSSGHARKVGRSCPSRLRAHRLVSYVAVTGLFSLRAVPGRSQDSTRPDSVLGEIDVVRRWKNRALARETARRAAGDVVSEDRAR